MGVAGVAEGVGDGEAFFEKSGEVLRRNFNACDGVVEADAELREPKIAKDVFGAFDSGEEFFVDRDMIGEARDKAGGGGLACRGEFHFPRELTDFLFGETELLEGLGDTEFLDGTVTGAVVLEIVGIAAVDDHGNVVLACEVREQGETVAFAEIATVR